MSKLRLSVNLFTIYFFLCREDQAFAFSEVWPRELPDSLRDQRRWNGKLHRQQAWRTQWLHCDGELDVISSKRKLWKHHEAESEGYVAQFTKLCIFLHLPYPPALLMIFSLCTFEAFNLERSPKIYQIPVTLNSHFNSSDQVTKNYVELQCGCENTSCPFCNIVLSIRNRDPAMDAEGLWWGFTSHNQRLWEATNLHQREG